MKFAKKTEEELLNLLPEGEYDGYVSHAKNGVSKANNSMITIRCSFPLSSGEERVIFTCLLEKYPLLLKHFCYTTGLESCYNNQELNDTDCLGKKIRAKVSIVNNAEYGLQNRIIDFVPHFNDNKNIPIPIPQDLKDFSDDDVPF